MNTLLTKGKMRLVTMLLASLVGCMNVANAFAATPPPTIDTDFVYFNASLSDFTLTTNSAGATMISSSVYDLTFKPDSLAPAMPYIPITVMLHADRAYHGLNYTTIDEVAASNVTMAANPIPVPTSMAARHSSTTIPKALASATLYPAYGQNVEYVGNSYADGHQLLHFLFCPFTYNATTHQLIFHNEISLEYEFYGDGSNTDNPPVVGTLDAGYFRSFVFNKNDVATIMAHDVQYTATHAQTMGYNPNPNVPDLDYLIITDSILVDTFMPLIEWKRMKGLNSFIVTTQQIYRDAENNSDSSQLKIKKYISECHFNNKLKYVLLGGDASVVPAQGCYSRVFRGLDENGDSILTSKYNIPADLYYCCFDGAFDWDGNGNGVCGEYDDECSFSSDLFVSRAAVRTKDDVSAFVQKTMNYEICPTDFTWNNNILLSGCHTHYTCLIDGQLKNDAQYEGEEIYNKSIAPYWNGQASYLYDTFQNVEYENLPYPFSPSNLQEQLSKCYTFVHVGTHGGENSWETYYGFYTTERADTLRNTGLTLVTTDACLTNAFDYVNPCLSESFICNPNSGVFAYLGCSREGWGYSEYFNKIGPSATFTSQFYKTLFSGETTGNNYAQIVANMKLDLLPTCDDDSANRWLLLGVNPIGDPETPIFSAHPSSINAQISYDNDSLCVRLFTYGCRTCITKRTASGDEKLIYEDADSIKIPLDSELIVCITKKNHIPKVFRYSVLCIQNEEICTNQIFEADCVRVGSNVTNNKPEGPVVFDNESSTLIKADRIVLKGLVNINKGSTLRIERK